MGQLKANLAKSRIGKNVAELVLSLKKKFVTKVIKKEDNGFIDIEYSNKIGEHKAKMLIEYFKQNKEFWQYFLQRKIKIVIGKEDNTLDNEIFINDSKYQNSFDDQTILEQILTSDKEKEFILLLVTKLANREVGLLSQNDYLTLIKRELFGMMLDGKKIDFFEYLDLARGKIEFIDVDYYYDKALVDVAFEKGYFGWLDQYMNTNEDSVVKGVQKNVLAILHNQYGTVLFNELLGEQAKLLSEYSNNFNDSFLESNIQSLNDFFKEEMFNFYSKYYVEKNTSNDKNKVSREEIIGLVIEFINKVDSTGKLGQEFIDYLENGTFVLWDKEDTDLQKEMKQRCAKFGCKDIYSPCCLYNCNGNGEICDLMVNVPLVHTLDDVCTIVHEFFHLHATKSSGKTIQNKLLKEALSIYFETLCRDFLIEKGCSKEDISINFRIEDACSNFNIISPVIVFLGMYMGNGIVTREMLNDFVAEIKKKIALECLQAQLSPEDTVKEFNRQGFGGTIEEISYNMMFYVNSVLLIQRKNIFTLTPYLIGTIIANNAINNGCRVEDMIRLSERINDIGDVTSVMTMVGIDINKYGFKANNELNK